MTRDHWTRRLKRLGARAGFVEMAHEYPSLQAAWNARERADEMLWLLVRLHGYRGAGGPRGVRLRRDGAACLAATAPRRRAPRRRNQDRPTLRERHGHSV